MVLCPMSATRYAPAVMHGVVYIIYLAHGAAQRQDVDGLQRSKGNTSHSCLIQHRFLIVHVHSSKFALQAHQLSEAMQRRSVDTERS
jgi:hypothetical protein